MVIRGISSTYKPLPDRFPRTRPNLTSGSDEAERNMLASWWHRSFLADLDDEYLQPCLLLSANFSPPPITLGNIGDDHQQFRRSKESRRYLQLASMAFWYMLL
jgi:hypothetical protein